MSNDDEMYTGNKEYLRTCLRGGARPGAGRPLNPDRKVKISPSVSPGFKKMLAEYAIEVNESQGSIIERLVRSSYGVRYWLDK